MISNSSKLLLFLSVLFLAGVFSVGLALASTTNGTINPTYKYAWSENIGWINFGCDSCNVHVTDAGLTGYIWINNYGRISLNPSNGGVKNDGNGILSGYAWSENIGRINFTGVTIDSNGQFQGLAAGDNTGKINFNYDPTPNCPTCTIVRVTTDWRPKSARKTTSSGGGSYSFQYASSSKETAVASSTGGLAQKIQELLSQLSFLQEQLSQITGKSSSSFIFTSFLTLGSEGEEVRQLQQLLKDQGSAIYPEGKVTGYFGSLTRKAVIRFQEKYASETLTPSGFVKGTGYVGPYTRKKLNSLLGNK